VAEWDVPGYTELKPLGSGGFGYVVLARHDASGTLVAIKYLRRDLLSDPGFATMFRSEAAVLASMDDPNVVRLYEYVESGSGAAIVMELVDGVSLREILTQHGATTPEAALVVLHGSLLGLAAAHQRGVVHRDYKPENVLINGAGDSKLTDFGIAARAGDRPPPAGTVAYAPPEQFGGSPVSPASDVYAATATFYECLTGQPPFSGKTPEVLLYQHLAEPVPLEQVPEPLRSLVAAGMAKEPGARPTNAATFVTELDAVAGVYGPDWHERGRSHLAEAALLLVALWPTSKPPAVEGTTVERIPLLRRIGVVRAAIAIAIAIAVASALSALAATHSTRPDVASSPAAVVLSLAPSPGSSSTSPGSSSTSPGSSSSSPGSPSSSPVITGVSPSGGSTAGGASVTVTGTGLAGATGVSFGTAAATIITDSSTQITVTSPATGAGTVDISVTTPAGTSAISPADQFTYTAVAAPPVVTAISPNSGSTAGGDSVTVTGTGLSGATGVSFGGTAATITAYSGASGVSLGGRAATITADSSTQITVTSPASACPGTVDVTVTTPAGTSAITQNDEFTYTAAGPAVTGVSPASGSTAGGDSVTITGTGLGCAGSVSFGGTAATITADSSTQITVTSPPSKVPGEVDVTVTTPAGTSAATDGDLFTYYTPETSTSPVSSTPPASSPSPDYGD